MFSWKRSAVRGGIIEKDDTAALIDEIPVLAVLGAASEEGLTVRDARELRIKETDRIATVAENLRRMGVAVEELPDGLVVPGRQRFRAAELDSFGDHRIAMAFAVAALRGGRRVGDPQRRGGLGVVPGVLGDARPGGVVGRGSARRARWSSGCCGGSGRLTSSTLRDGGANPLEGKPAGEGLELAAQVLVADGAAGFAQHQQVAQQVVEHLQIEIELLALAAADGFRVGDPALERRLRRRPLSAAPAWRRGACRRPPGRARRPCRGCRPASAMRFSGWSSARARTNCAHLFARKRREVERHGARADGGQQVVGVLRRHDQDEVVGRLLERLQQRVGGLVVGAVDVIDEEDAAAAAHGLERGALLEQARLLDGDLAQRAVGREGDEIRVAWRRRAGRRCACPRATFRGRRWWRALCGQAEVVLLDLLRRGRAGGRPGGGPAWPCRRPPGRRTAGSAGGAPGGASARAPR